MNLTMNESNQKLLLVHHVFETVSQNCSISERD